MSDEMFLFMREVIRLTSEAVRQGPIEQRRAVEVERNGTLRVVPEPHDDDTQERGQ